MTENEALRVVRILFLADFGCSICAEKLCQQFIAEFPEFSKLVHEEFKKEFGIEIGSPMRTHIYTSINPIPGVDQ